MRFTTLLIAVLQPALSLFAYAQLSGPPYDPSPFFTTGYITAASLDDPNDVLSGGRITVNNIHDIKVPKNQLVGLPGITSVAYSALFNGGSLSLPDWPQTNWEVVVFANLINGQYISGIVFVTQEFGITHQGFITHIDYDAGELRVAGDFSNPSSGARVVINDPVGRYGKAHGDWPLWTADTDNPAITATTGYPVCIPRVDPNVGDDPLCPKKNRPLDATGKHLTKLTFGSGPFDSRTPDPNLFAPLVVGDFITYSGITVNDGNGPLLAAYVLEANLGFYTKPGTKPVYLRIEGQQGGINGNPAGEIAEDRVEGFSTDQTTTVNFFALDVDPCNGAETERLWGNVQPDTAGKVGFFRFRSKDPNLNPITRELRIRAATGTVDTPNGITAGEYTSPFGPDSFIFPELVTFGDPMIPHEFNLMPFLAQGSGPLDGSGPVVGQLSPWPGIGSPTPVNCPDPSIPIANAGADLTATSSGAVLLAGAIKNNVNLNTVTFAWTQTGGSTVPLTGANTINATFTAPSVTTVTVLTFKLTTSAAAGSTSDDVQVTISPPAATVDTVTIQSATWKSGKGSGTLTVIARSTNLNAHLFMTATNPDISSTAMTTSLGNGQWQVLVTVKPQPVSVKVTSDKGGSATATVTKG